MTQSTTRALVAVSLMLAAAGTSSAGQTRPLAGDTRSAAKGLQAELSAIAARGGVTWAGYREKMIAGQRELCCSNEWGQSACRLESGSAVTMTTGDRGAPGSRVVLEPPSELLVLARFEGGAITRLRLFSPDCDIDTTGATVVWLTDVKSDESIAWLSTLATTRTATAKTRNDSDRVAKQAVAAIALHDTPSADRVLASFVASNQPESLRGDTAFWLGSARGESGERLLEKMLQDDPSDNVREKVTFGLSVSPVAPAQTALINIARNDRSPRVRSRALFWLAQKAGKAAVATLADAIDRDPETDVKKKAVFALTQLPDGEGVPKLIEVARTNRNPEVRKQAFFWLGQSKDPRALQFIEDVLVRSK